METYFDKTQKYIPKPDINPDDKFVWKRIQREYNPEGETLENLKK